MHDKIRLSTPRPNQQQYVFAVGNRMYLLHKRIRVLDRMPIDFENHVSGSKARIVRGASWPNALDGRALHMFRDVELLPHLLGQLGNCEAQLAVLFRSRFGIVGNFRVGVIFTNRDFNRLRLAVAKYAERNRVAGRHLAHCNLQRASIHDLAAIDLAQHVSRFQPCSAGRRVRRDLADDRSGRVRQVEETGLVRRDVIHANAQVPVMHRAVLDELFD